MVKEVLSLLDKFTVYEEERKANGQLRTCVIKTSKAHIEGALISVRKDEERFS